MEKGEKDAIEAKTAALAQASAAIAQKLYAQQGEQEAGSAGAASGEGDSDSEEVVDAEFEEVDDDRKSKSG
jgi:molecular chaperone DnaK